jgi:CreA protein
MPAITNFDGGLTLSFRSKDRKRSADWYSKVLGFSLLYDVAEIGWCEMSTHIPKLNVGFSEVKDLSPGGLVPTFGVTDIDSARASMEKHHVKFDGPTQTIPGMVKLATFFDPDGNPLMLFQDLSKA